LLRSLSLTMTRCRDCGLVREVQSPGAVTCNYDSIYPLSPPGGRPDRKALRRFREWENDLRRLAPGGGRVLDLGCSYGFFVEYLREWGWEAEGADPCAHAVTYARARGLPCRRAVIEGLDNRGSYELVSMIHVLEHLPDPVGALKLVSRLLKPGGALYLRVPNFASALVQKSSRDLLGHLKPREHLWYFTPETLARTLEAAGLEPEVRAAGRNTIADLVNGRIRARLVLSPSWQAYNYQVPAAKKSLYNLGRSLYEKYLLRALSWVSLGQPDREVIASARAHGKEI